MVIAPRFTWDIQIGAKGIYISPFIRTGLAIIFGQGVAFEMQFGARAKFILNDRALLFIQPLGLEVLAGNAGSAIAYQLLFGYGSTF